MDAARKCQIGRVQVLIDAGANVKSEKGSRTLALAIAHGNKDIVQILLDQGADPNTRVSFWRENNSNLALTDAIQHCKIEIVKITQLLWSTFY